MLRHKGRVFPAVEMEEGTFEEPGYLDCEWKEILASLDEKYKTVILLYYSKALSVKEIAALLGMKFKKAFPAVIIGICMATVIMWFISYVLLGGVHLLG